MLLTNHLPEDKTETASARVESSTVFSFAHIAEDSQFDYYFIIAYFRLEIHTKLRAHKRKQKQSNISRNRPTNTLHWQEP